tara:strand:- start:1074 stop:1601 length:528 start_codon:yes stop_codon:yes gene_type:complete
MKKRKESIVVFEDWFKYARCLNDTEFRQLITSVLEYYKTQTIPPFTGLLLDVWNDIFDDLEVNVSKKQAKRDTMLRNSKSNPKLNPVSNNVPDIGPDTKPNNEPKIEPKTAGMVMVDGGCEMVDDRLEREDDEMMDEPDVEWFLNELDTKGNIGILKSKYPHSSSLSEAIGMYFE